MTRFSANFGILWAERPLPEAIRAAAAAGFDVVEPHWPYAKPAAEVAAALAVTSLPLLSLNTVRGDAAAGEIGLRALPGARRRRGRRSTRRWPTPRRRAARRSM